MNEWLSMGEGPTPRQQSKRLALLEFALIVAVYVADWQHHFFLSKVPSLLLLGGLSLRLRAMRWRDVGFGVPGNWGETLLIGVLAGAGIELLELFGTQPVLVRLTGQMPDLSAFARVAGDGKWLAISLALTWTLFAFGEELFFRGYLLNRIADLIGRTRGSWIAALVLSSLMFGVSHFHQGITGVSEDFIDGMILGALYLKCGCHLAVPIIAHGVTDTAEFLLIFLHRYPGLHQIPGPGALRVCESRSAREFARVLLGSLKIGWMPEPYNRGHRARGLWGRFEAASVPMAC